MTKMQKAVATLVLGMAAALGILGLPVASFGDEAGSGALRQMVKCNSDGTFTCDFPCPSDYREKGWCCYG